MDDEVSRLLARTRARREAVNKKLRSVGENEREIRSPLKERNETRCRTSREEAEIVKESGKMLEKTITTTTEEIIETRKVVKFEGSGKDAEGIREMISSTMREEGEMKKEEEKTKKSYESPTRNNSPMKRRKDFETYEGSGVEGKKNEEDPGIFEDEKSARKKRLKNLAQKYENWEDDTDFGRHKPSVSSEVVDVDAAIMNTKPPLKQNPSFVESLKAQGFQETSSKSKLVYDFNKRPRSPSPVKKYPPVRTTVSPSRSSNMTPRRSPSPHKPHPLQYVSPQKYGAPITGPPKPVRTFQLTKDMTDTASRQSIIEKKTLFEKTSGDSHMKQAIDPALLSVSERKALFEKNKTAPKPVARFGEAVTPAMLHKAAAQSKIYSKSAISPVETEWKRRGDNVTLNAVTSKSRRKSTSSQKDSYNSKSETVNAETRRKLFDKEDNNFESNDAHLSDDESSVNTLTNRDEHSQQIKEDKMEIKKTDHNLPEGERYPGINSMKIIKVSPPKPGHLYPNLSDIESDTLPRPSTAMSTYSTAPSEAPSLGNAIQRVASRKFDHPSVPSTSDDNDDGMEDAAASDNIEEILDEALDDSELSFSEDGPTPPKVSKSSQSTLVMAARSPTTSTSSWEFENASTMTPVGKCHNTYHKDFKTPLIEENDSPIRTNLPEVEGVNKGLLHSVSSFRKQKPQQIITRNEVMRASGHSEEEDPEICRQNIWHKIRLLQEDSMQQEQRMEQSSKALNYCASKNEFEGSYERVEGERLLLEAFHKYTAAMAEVASLKTLGTMGKATPQRNKPSGCKGSVSISGITLSLKNDFLRIINSGAIDSVHYFVCLVKYKNQVIATQMLSSIDGISKGQLHFPNLIVVRDLDFDFQINLEVYGLQTPKEMLTHEAKYHIRKEKSVFNLTPLKKLKKQEVSRLPGPRNQNPVNSKTIRRPSFGKVGHTIVNLDSVKNKRYFLNDVPPLSPLEKDLHMNLSAHSENKVEKNGFLTIFTDVNGYGDWHRRWCLLSGNTLRFWKYPEDEMKEEPKFEINLSSCITEHVTLAPREICSRMNTFMFETQRQTRSSDRQSLIMHVNRKSGLTRIRHLVMSDTRDERILWCDIINGALVNLRAWDPTSYRSRVGSDSSQASTVSSMSQGSRDCTDTATISCSSTDIW